MADLSIDLYTAKYATASDCGIDKMMAELSPLFEFMWDDYQHLFLMRTNTEYLMRHKDVMECFLHKAGYHYEYYPNMEFTTNFREFRNDIDRLINNHNLDVDDVQHISNIISMLHGYLYDEEAERMVSTAKARYLCKILKETIMEIEDVGSEPAICVCVANILTADIISYSEEFDRFLVELGFLPEIPGVSNVSGFADYIVEYINSGRYIEDRFLSGEGILRKFNQYIRPIDWYSHI